MKNATRLTDRQALDAICALLDAQEWDAETLNEVAELLRSTGRPIADVSEL